ncbi:MAG: Leucine-responsive regulatory protein [Candidatus Heimdallarchaeota archaeon LC_2]|nr:MAG: Leucine-responsive regulatory protein [Candidatus Heimdallarchaeota archaeon LC_2]
MEFSPVFKIDKLDFKILRELKVNSKRSIRQLASRINESHSTVYNRIIRLESSGIIKKWTVAIDYSLLNLDIIFYVSINIEYEGYGDSPLKFNCFNICQEIMQLKGVCELSMINGEFDILAKVRTNSLQTTAEIIIDQIRIIPGVSKVVSNHCYQTILEECNIDKFDFHEVFLDIKENEINNEKLAKAKFAELFGDMH